MLQILMEPGYINFPKIDVRLQDIFTVLELCNDGADDYQLFKAIIRVASNPNVTPYAADKVFWLIGNGNFYPDPSIKLIGGHKQDFIDYALPKARNGIEEIKRYYPKYS